MPRRYTANTKNMYTKYDVIESCRVEAKTPSQRHYESSVAIMKCKIFVKHICIYIFIHTKK